MASANSLKLYFHRSPNSLKVLLLLEETGTPYQIMPVDIYGGEQHRPEFLKLNPNAKVPALQDGEVTVFDSNAILLYIAERKKAFLAESLTEHGLVLSWLMFVASGLGPFSGQSVHFLRYAPEKIPYAINRYTKEAERHYRVLDARLKDSPYLAGIKYTIADMAAWGWVALSGMVLAGASLENYLAVNRWFQQIGARPATMRAQAVSASVHAKDVLDEAARKILFPQNVHLAPQP